MRGRIVIRHRPCNGQKTKEEGEALWLPSGIGLDVREYVFGCILVLGLDQQGDAARDQNADVEDHVPLGHFLDPVCGHGVYAAGYQGETGHDADGVPVGDLVAEVGAHAHGSEEHLRGAVFGGGYTCDLAEEVDPAC